METVQPRLYRPVHRDNVQRTSIWQRLPDPLREALEVSSLVFPFRTNNYVIERLIDWDRIPEDPIFQLTFPQPGMLPERDYIRLRDAWRSHRDPRQVADLVNRIRLRMNPHPAGQLTHNVPVFRGKPLEGVQHKYRETVLFFPSQGQTCHAYCTYCFRWPQFVGMPGLKFQAPNALALRDYLLEHPEVTDVLLTGGDPLIMRTSILDRHVEPLLDPALAHLQTVRIGTKAISYWPFRFLTDPDADALLRLFERIVASGRHLAVMAHFSHPVELEPAEVQSAIARIRATGAQIRVQAPLVRHVNDSPEAWSDLWRMSVRLGMVPYYMFVERNTGPKRYFRVPLAQAFRIYRAAYRAVSGLARTVRGPSMSAFPGKIQVVGVAEVQTERVFVLRFLQGRNPDWVGRPFFAQYDPDAYWLDDLRPAFGLERFFFESGAAEPTRSVPTPAVSHLQ